MNESYLSREEYKYFEILYQLKTEPNIFEGFWIGRVACVLHFYFMIIKYLVLKNEKIKISFNFEELLSYYNILIKEDCLTNYDKNSFKNFFDVLNYDIENKIFSEKVDFNFNEQYFYYIKKYFINFDSAHINYLEKAINNKNGKKEYISQKLIEIIKNKAENENKDINLIELYVYVYRYKLSKNNDQMLEICESFKDFLLSLQEMVMDNNILNNIEKQCIESYLHYIGLFNDFNIKKLIKYDQKSIIYLEDEDINDIAANYFKHNVMETKKILLESNLIIDYLRIEENMKNF